MRLRSSLVLATACVALAACGPSTDKLLSGPFVPVLALQDGSVVYCDASARELRVLPAKDRETPVTLVAVPGCDALPTVLGARYAVVVQPLDADRWKANPAVVWAASSGRFTTEPTARLTSTRLAGSPDGKWLFVFQRVSPDEPLEHLVGYDLGQQSPAPRGFSPYVDPKGWPRVLTRTGGGTHVAVRLKREEADQNVVLSYDWAADFKETVLFENSGGGAFGWFTRSQDGRFVFTGTPDWELVRVPVAGGEAVLTGLVNPDDFRVSRDGTQALGRAFAGDLHLWKDGEELRPVATGVLALGAVDPGFTHVAVATSEAEHFGDGDEPWYTTDVSLVNLASGRIVQLSAKEDALLPSAAFSPDGSFLVWLDDAAELGHGTLRGCEVSGCEPRTIAARVGSATFNDDGILLIDSDHQGKTLWGSDSRYSISMLAEPWDDEPQVLATDTVAGRVTVAGQPWFFHVVAGDGLYFTQF